MTLGSSETGGRMAATVQRIERLVGGDPATEEQILRFIGERYSARNLLYLPGHVAAQILRRPADFVAAARRRGEPNLPFG